MVERSVFLSDIHIPFQDDTAVNAALRLIKLIKPREVFLNGDILDCYQLSRFSIDPERLLGIQDDLDTLTEFLSALREAAPEAHIVFTEGNHEERIVKYLRNNPEISNLRSLTPENMLGLSAFNIQWVPSLQTHTYKGTIVTHGSIVRKQSAYSARGQLEKYGISGVSGHTHRLGTHWRTDLRGTYYWLETGCLCSLKSEYIIGVPDWQQGLAVGTYLDGNFSITTYPITDGKVVFEGAVV